MFPWLNYFCWNESDLLGCFDKLFWEEKKKWEWQTKQFSNQRCVFGGWVGWETFCACQKSTLLCVVTFTCQRAASWLRFPCLREDVLDFSWVQCLSSFWPQMALSTFRYKRSKEIPDFCVFPWNSHPQLCWLQITLPPPPQFPTISGLLWASQGNEVCLVLSFFLPSLAPPAWYGNIEIAAPPLQHLQSRNQSTIPWAEIEVSWALSPMSSLHSVQLHKISVN